MKRALVLSIVMICATYYNIQASNIYYVGDYIVSELFSVRPEFSVPRVNSFYSPLFSVRDMPDALFMADGIKITNKTKVKDTSKLSFSIDYGTNPYTKIKDVKYFVNNITDNEMFMSNEITLNGNKATSDIDRTFVIGKIYEIGQVTNFTDGFAYETKSVPFLINQKGLIEFLTPDGNVLFSNNITMRFESKDSEKLNIYNVYLQYTNGEKELVGDKIKAEDTLISKNDNGYSTYQFKHQLKDTYKKFKYIIEIVE